MSEFSHIIIDSTSTRHYDLPRRNDVTMRIQKKCVGRVVHSFVN